MRALNRPLLFLLFFVSGFCGLLYQVVWTRLAFASFGIITPVLSVVISVFMLGLSLGAWAGGRWIGALTRRTGLSAVLFYALAELMIGLGAVAVPTLFKLGEHWLLASGQSDSVGYLMFSALVLTFSILPWCVFMGATFPLMMAYVREREPASADSFSYLYLANVLGAMAGALLTALVLVECLGFRHTLWVAGAGNLVIAAISVWLGTKKAEGRGLEPRVQQPAGEPGAAGAGAGAERGRLIQWVLFSTGFVSMAMEVVWIRAFAPVLKTQVYSFALVVAVYLGATFLGSLLYRRHLRGSGPRPMAELMGLLCAAALLPVLANDPRWVKADWLCEADPLSVVILLASICPLCGLLGYLTPGLVDEYAAGWPARAGRAYALNVLGCILGPLAACYLFLPWMSDRTALVVLSLPFFGFFLLGFQALPAKRRLGLGLAAGAVLGGALFFSGSYEERVLRTEKHAVVRRDYAASVLSYGEGLDRLLCVNGIGMTRLTPVTKLMVHLPLAFHHGRPESALVICFGMGTTYRSALSWDIETTAVELVPSVKDAFDFFHADAAQVLKNPKGRIVVDDGRRYLRRTREQYDVIVIDPPPPVETAGSSLLYSEEFYAAAKERLKPGGILETWYPGGDLLAARAMVRSLCEAFPYVRLFGGVEGYGTHLLASREPIERLSGAELAARMPARAREDLVEWNPGQDVAAWLSEVVTKEFDARQVVHPDPRVRITDDLPYNEYFLLRGKQL
jgi:spermidine synthase